MRLGVRGYEAALVAAIALALALSGCGGSGGGGAQDQQSLLSGTYHFVLLSGALAGATLRGETGTATADGAGTLTLHESYAAEEGAPSGPFVPPSRTFHITPERLCTLVDAANLQMQGRIAMDGSLAALTSRAESTSPMFMVMARRNASPTLAALAGTWLFVHWGRHQAAGVLSTFAVGSVDVDAAGGVTYQRFHYNTDKAIDPFRIQHEMEQIVLGAGGWLLWENLTKSLMELRGGMSEDGNLLLFGGHEGNGGYAVLRLLVRTGLGTGTSDLAGAYGTAGVGADPDGPAWMTVWGPMGLNGSGAGTWDMTALSLGDVVPSGELPIVYTMTAQGTLQLGVYASSTTFEGAVGPGGRYAVLAGLFQDGAPPWGQVLIR